MLLFSSRDLTMPRVCLWGLVASIQLVCPYAFDFLSHNAAVSLSPSSHSSKFHASLPRNKYLHLRNFMTRSPSSIKYKRSSSIPFTKPSRKHQNWESTFTNSYPPSFISQPVFSEVTPLIDKPLSKNDVLAIENLNQPWGPAADESRSSAKWLLANPFGEVKTLKQYYGLLARMKSLKSALRRRIKERNILGDKLRLKARNKLRLNEMTKLEKVALEKSLPSAFNPRSVKSRRAEYLERRQSFQNGLENEDIRPTERSFTRGFKSGFGGTNFVANNNPHVFRGFDVGRNDAHVSGKTEDFAVDPLLTNPQFGLAVDNRGKFASALPPGPPPSSLNPSSGDYYFSHNPKQSKQNFFGGFSDPQLPPIQQSSLPTRGSFGFFAPSSSQSDASDQESSVVAFERGSSSGKSFSTGGNFAGGFGSFEQNDKDCATIETKNCHTSVDCACHGFYSCFGGRCRLKQGAKGKSRHAGRSDPMGGTWHQAPLVDVADSADSTGSFYSYKPTK